MGIALFILSAVTMVASLVYSIINTREVKNNTITKINFPAYFKKNGIVGAIFSVSFMAMFLSIYLWAKITPMPGEFIQTIIGGILFSGLGYISLHTFILHYYGKKIPEDINKKLFIALAISFPLALFFVFILSNGFANYMNLEEPLVNGISFTDGWVTPWNGRTSIAFYAICIISGAFYTYMYADHKFYIEYGKHGILESTFLVAFPAGIIGARLFYVIGLWDEFKGTGFINMIDMRDGGLTILGGAITGIVVGVAWFLWRNKQYSIWVAVDIIVPAILIAQAAGRWGNFFNCEVYGQVSDGKYWWWLPKIVYNNMHYSTLYSLRNNPLPIGQIYVPLFFIECLTNLLGFFVLAHVFGKALRKYTELGDLAFGYIVWYGLTRVFMEPIRDSAYKMNFWSWFWSFAFVVIGTLLIVGNHIVRYIIRKKKGEFHAKKNAFNVGVISTLAIAAASLGLMIPGILTMVNNTFENTEPIFNQFNIGLTLFVLGISVFLCLGISIPILVEGVKNLHNDKVRSDLA